MEIRLGLADFTYFLSARRGKMTDPELLDRAAALGLQCAQVSAGRPEDTGRRSALRQQAEHLSLDLVLGAGGPPTVATFEREIRFAAELGARVVRHACGPFRLRKKPLPPRDLAQVLARTAMRAEADDVTVAVENHQDYTGAELAQVMGQVDSPRVGVCLDTGNSIALMEDPLETAAALVPFARAVHVKEYLVLPAEGGIDLVGTPLGTGVVDNAAIFAMLLGKAPVEVLYANIENPLERCTVPILSPEYAEMFASEPLGRLGPVARLMQESRRKHPGPVELPGEGELSDQEVLAAEDAANAAAVAWCRKALRL